MLGIFQSLFNPHSRRISELKTVVEKIHSAEDSYGSLEGEKLQTEAQLLRQQVREGLAKLDPTLDDFIVQERELLEAFLPKAFALVRAAFGEIFNEWTYDEQLMVGILLHRGFAAEQKTGEGKTHAAVHPLFLNSLTGRGAHLVTVNDYLARRDSEWMGLIYSRLGVSVGCINSGNKSYVFDSSKVEEFRPADGSWRGFPFGHGSFLREVTRKEAYQADITYGTNNEFGFDYLRDNMVHSLDQIVQINAVGEMGVHHFVIVDEVDSILIDEARTPLIISAPAEESNELYQRFATLVKQLNAEDYTIDEKGKAAFFD